MSAINVNSITGRTGSHGPVLTGLTTFTGDLHVGGGVSFSGITTVSTSLHVVGTGSSVGIGTDNPGNKLEVNSGTDNEGIKVVSTDAGSYITVADNTTTGSTRFGAIGDDFKIDVASGERLRIGSAGSVHIGDELSNANGHGLLSLTQNASAAFNALVIQQGNTGFNAHDGLHIGIDAGVHAYFKTFENRDFIFYTGSTNTEKLRLTSTGRLGIGTNNPDTNVAVLGNTDGVVNLDTTDSRGAFVRFRENGTSKAWVGCSEGIGSGGDQDDLGLRAVDNIRLRAGDNYVTINSSSGNIVMGAGAGIDFSADTGSNAGSSSAVLNDYEEGVYTPTFTCGSGSITLNGSYNIISYEKIGNCCHVHGRVRVSSVSSPGGALTIGLPFTRANPGEDSARIGGTIVVQNGSSAVVNYLIHPTGATGAEVARGDSSAIDTTVADNFSGDELVYVSITYRTT